MILIFLSLFLFLLSSHTNNKPVKAEVGAKVGAKVGAEVGAVVGALVTNTKELEKKS